MRWDCNLDEFSHFQALAWVLGCESSERIRTQIRTFLSWLSVGEPNPPAPNPPPPPKPPPPPNPPPSPPPPPPPKEASPARHQDSPWPQICNTIVNAKSEIQCSQNDETCLHPTSCLSAVSVNSRKNPPWRKTTRWKLPVKMNSQVPRSRARRSAMAEWKHLRCFLRKHNVENESDWTFPRLSDALTSRSHAHDRRSTTTCRIRARRESFFSLRASCSILALQTRPDMFEWHELDEVTKSFPFCSWQIVFTHFSSFILWVSQIWRSFVLLHCLLHADKQLHVLQVMSHCLGHRNDWN